MSNVLRSLLMVALLACGSAVAADNSVQVNNEQGRPVAQFNIGDSRCVLQDDQIRCTRVSK
jgi:hypothetical protein